MSRAHRYFLPNHVWHITHRRHTKYFLLKFVRDQRRWLYWLHEVGSRFGLCVLDYTVTSNHIHLLVRDQGRGEIPRGMQLGRRENCARIQPTHESQRAFQKDRYHATVVDKGEYLAHCITYIDLNMVRAGAMSHPSAWPDGGYQEIQLPQRVQQIL